jgi:hypothetical protein
MSEDERQPLSWTARERETVVTVSDADEVVHIWTAQRAVIGQLRRHPSFSEVRGDSHAPSRWAEFTIPAHLWNPTRGAKRPRRPLTEDERAVVVARLAAVNAARKRPDLVADPHRQSTSGDEQGHPGT